MSGSAPFDFDAARHVVLRLHDDLQRLARQEQADADEHGDDETALSLAVVIDLLRIAASDFMTLLAPKNGATMTPTLFYLDADAQAIFERLVAQSSACSVLAVVVDHYAGDLRNAGREVVTGFVRLIRREGQDLCGLADELAAWHEQQEKVAAAQQLKRFKEYIEQTGPTQEKGGAE
jgi:hypothetical protein